MAPGPRNSLSSSASPASAIPKRGITTGARDSMTRPDKTAYLCGPECQHRLGKARVRELAYEESGLCGFEPQHHHGW
ncbi:hypothetical protein GCM10010289_39510 [Streptomyces violascens]|uniref:Uncharacterized protein n=1 Tax=Streptomyces violascens TaxID=67381 RepID=A0ABQ3QXJ2_9ACTN|nr:hypothetical protein GCM10010289_39510 [Streptomyces violascens]GHI42001.1 hypothetical protein Sviol_64090 [Streptomyces violascens]